jgi:hypothetical protein
MKTKAAGLERAALAMLRTMGAGTAKLLLTQPAVATAQIGLGLDAPPATEVEMDPVLLQTSVNGNDLLAIATRGTVHMAINVEDSAQAARLLSTSMLQAGDTEYRIVSVTVKRFGGVEMLYELGIEE